MKTIKDKLQAAYELGRIAGAAETIDDEATRDCIYGSAQTLFDGVLTEAPEPRRPRTNLEWLASNPERLVEALYCPRAFCRHETELTIDNTDICRKCLLDWLKEEHKDD